MYHTAKSCIALFLLLNITLSARGQSPFKIKVDHRFEAISIFYTLATADSLDTKPTPSRYYKDVKDYFAACKYHSSLQWYRKLDKWDGFDIASFGIYLSSSYPFKVAEKIETGYIRSAPVDTFLHYLNKFYHECSVRDFLAKHQQYYTKIIAHAEDTIGKSKILGDVSAFYGLPQKKEFLIYLDLLNNLGSNAITLTSGKLKGKRINRIAYLSDSSAHLTDQDAVIFNPYLNVVAHECSHTFVSDFIPLYEHQLYKIRKLFLTTAKGSVLTDNEWKNELDELIVRVCVAKILEKRDGKQAGLEEINNQARHFRLAKSLYDFLDDYTLRRDRYKTFTQFYPVLINYLEKTAANN